MLDVIADFWKPVKKSQDKLQPEQLQIGSAIGFGFVPQASLSGRRLEVSAINTYQFGEESLTSFVLSQGKEPGVSMIVAEAEGEQYLAISRRISAGDRTKLFNSYDLESVMGKPDITRLTCRDNNPDYKGWAVPVYKREIQGLKGRIFKGDFRKQPLPPVAEAQEFEYTLLVSESNEHAIEIEKYADGHIEVYTTVYRRMNDIGEITHPGSETGRPDIKLASSTPQPVKMEAAPALAPAMGGSVKAEVKTSPVVLKEFAAPAPAEPKAAEAKAPAVIKAPVAAETPAVEEKKPEPAVTIKEEPISMTMTETAINGTRNDMTASESMKPKLYVQPTAPETYMKQEIKAVNNRATNTNFESDAIECDLRVANKIIDEAIRNEMRLTDIVRRIIELPVAYPESVQIPVTLTDEDYALLAIRYGIPASDKNAIKRRIIEDLNDFSGNGAGRKAA
ncbi:MAG: hypothetical protein KGJ06_01250 [Pseudomonadota bacterium]|nr:hypothetical protein [Pseudomonadota bacterium]